MNGIDLWWEANVEQPCFQISNENLSAKFWNLFTIWVKIFYMVRSGLTERAESNRSVVYPCNCKFNKSVYSLVNFSISLFALFKSMLDEE